MKSFTTRRFREMYAGLPDRIRLSTRKAYELFRNDPSHPGLNLKKVDKENNVYSARVGIGYRALGRLENQEMVWFWIGPHSEYDKVV
jgi:hypothetical protein